MSKIDIDTLKDIARKAAVDSTHRYNYMPAIAEDSVYWKPHEWVLEAMQIAVDHATNELISSVNQAIDSGLIPEVRNTLGNATYSSVKLVAAQRLRAAVKVDKR